MANELIGPEIRVRSAWAIGFRLSGI